MILSSFKNQLNLDNEIVAKKIKSKQKTSKTGEDLQKKYPLE